MKPFLHLFITIAAVTQLSSCSTIKEERTDCPTYLTVNVDAFIAGGHTDAVISCRAEDGTVQQERVTLAPYRGIGYELPVARDAGLSVSVVAGLENSSMTRSEVYSKDNCPFDPIYAFASDIRPAGDLDVISARPHKQYCKVSFICPEGTPEDAVFPYTLRVRSSFRGFDIFSLAPQQTDYSICSYADGEAGTKADGDGEGFGPEARWSGRTVILPRQNDNELYLDVFLPGNDYQAPGKLMYVIDLGKRFIDAGYDWTKEDLGDITVVVDFSRSSIEIVIRDWDESDEYSDIEV